MKSKLPDAIARPLAETLVSRFAPNSQRIEIAGGLFVFFSVGFVNLSEMLFDG